MAAWLKARQAGGAGRIVDSVHQVPGTYADGFAALVFAMLDWKEPLRKALAISLSRPLDSEFDSLAQALILKIGSDVLESGQAEAISGRPPYRGDQLVSNNWALFRALTENLHARPGDYSLLNRQLDCGLFPDSPVGQATPTCYHAKICAVLALHSRLCGDSRYHGRLQPGLDALLALVSPQGVLVPYGRSRNTLFGYGSAYLALRLGADIFQDGHYSWAAQRILQNLSRHQAPDGHIPAALNPNDWLRQDWDVYINNPDYNAYAAACLLLAERLAAVPPPQITPADGVSELGPLLAARIGGHYFACSMAGEFAPFGSPFFCDTRYAGLVPLLFDDGRQLRVFDQGYCWDGRDKTRSALLDPRVSGWIPYLEGGQKHYWVRQFDQLAWDWSRQVLRVEGTGRPSYGHPRPRWRRFLESRLYRRPARQIDLQVLRASLSTNLKMDFQFGRLQVESRCDDSTLPLKQSRLEASLWPTSPS